MDKLEKIVEELRSVKQENGNDYKVDLRITYTVKGVKVSLSDQSGTSSRMKKPMANLESALHEVLMEKLLRAKEGSQKNSYSERVKVAEHEILNNTSMASWYAERIDDLRKTEKQVTTMFKQSVTVYENCLAILNA
jgi:hypothetical protein